MLPLPIVYKWHDKFGETSSDEALKEAALANDRVQAKLAVGKPSRRLWRRSGWSIW